MEFLVIAYFLFTFAFVSAVLSVWGRKIDQKNKRIDLIKGKSENPFMDDLNQSLYARFIKPNISKAKVFLSKYAKKNSKNAKNAQTKTLEQQLRLAGIYMEASEFQFIKTMVLIISAALGVILFIALPIEDSYKLLVILFCVMLGFGGPTLYLRSKVSGHQNGIKRQLPDTFDLLSVCIEAGLSFDAALVKISEKMSGPFIDELLIVYREIQMGRSRRDAIQNMADNSSIEELKTFASALAQAEQLGIPINNIMGVQSKQLRVNRSQQAKEKGMKASIKMIIPMLVFIFPTIFIIILGPTIINVMSNFSGD